MQAKQTWSLNWDCKVDPNLSRPAAPPTVGGTTSVDRLWGDREPFFGVVPSVCFNVVVCSSKLGMFNHSIQSCWCSHVLQASMILLLHTSAGDLVSRESAGGMVVVLLVITGCVGLRFTVNVLFRKHVVLCPVPP